MAISRYKKTNVVKNNDADYKKVFSSRFGTLGLVQTGTTSFRQPTEQEIMNIQYVNENWGLGKRLYKLAYQYYGDSQYWWIIALFNGISTEAEIQFGQVIKVPTPLDVVLNLYGF
jgi:hypothetical protein